jgi:hypothetical protein
MSANTETRDALAFLDEQAARGTLTETPAPSGARAELIPLPEWFDRGDLVQLSPRTPCTPAQRDAVWIVRKVPASSRAVNYTIEDTARPGVALKAQAVHLVKFTGDAEAVREQLRAREAVADDKPRPVMGSLVTIDGPRWKEPASVLWVVFKVKDGGEAVSVTRLGGDTEKPGRYYPSIPVGMVTVVDPARVTLAP